MNDYMVVRDVTEVLVGYGIELCIGLLVIAGLMFSLTAFNHFNEAKRQRF